jgi:hypothetical protein
VRGNCLMAIDQYDFGRDSVRSNEKHKWRGSTWFAIKPATLRVKTV